MTPFYPEAPDDDSDALPVETVVTEHVPCLVEQYPSHTTHVYREGDHWRCSICQPLVEEEFVKAGVDSGED